MIEARLGIQQRVLPNYRILLFDKLASQCQYGCSVFAGEARDNEMVSPGTLQVAEFTKAINQHILYGRYYLCWQKGLIDWLKEFDPNVVIMEANPRYLHSYDAIRWLRRRGVKVIGWGLGAPKHTGFLADFSNVIKKKMVEQYDSIITYSNKGKNEYLSLGYPDNKIFVAPNAVTEKPKSNLSKDIKDFSTNQPVILFVGRLQERKRIDLLINACAELKEVISPALWIVGDGPVRNDLEKLAAEKYPSTIFFGSKFGDDLKYIFLKADLFVLPGTGGLAVQQAMSFALPVIVAEADGTQVDLVTKDNGWNVNTGDLDQLKLTIKNALDDPERLHDKGMASFNIIKNKINLDRMVDTFSEAILRVMSGQ